MAAANQVKVSGSLYLPWIRVDSQSPSNSNKFTAMIRVKAPEPIPSNNVFPIHLVVVLDVSGTTSQRATGPPWFVQMMEFIKDDEFHRKGSTQHQVEVATESGLVPIAKWISSPKHWGDVNKPAMEVALKGLKSSGNPAGFIILVSDGGSKFDYRGFEKQLTKGRCPPVHAFGLGNRHNPKALHDIAKKSGGTYSSVPIVNSKVVMEAIALCLGGLKSVVAIDTIVKLSVPARKGGDNTPIQDLEVVDIQSGGFDHSKERKDKITVGVLYGGEVKDFIVRIKFKSTPSEFWAHGRTRSCYLTAAVEYNDCSSNKQQPPKYKVPLLVTSSHDKGAREAYKVLEEQAPNPRVLRQMILFEVVEMLLKFAEKKEAKGLPAKWKELKDRNENLQVAQKNDILVDLIDGIDKDIKALAQSLDGGSGFGCIYSWVSSYQMQRTTTTGLPLPPPPPPPFLTQAAMKTLQPSPGPGPGEDKAGPSTPQARAAGTTERQRVAKTLLDNKLEHVFDERDQSRKDQNPMNSTANELHGNSIVKKVLKIVQEETEGYRTTNTSGESLEDTIKSTIAIWLLDCSIHNQELKVRARSKDKIDDQIYKDVKEAIKYMRAAAAAAREVAGGRPA